jgi:hypothetical protein
VVCLNYSIKRYISAFQQTIRSNSTLLGGESAHLGDIKEFHGFQGSDNGVEKAECIIV